MLTTRRRSCAPTRCRDRVRPRASGFGRPCLDLAGRRSRSPAVRLRSLTPVRRGSAPWSRSRCPNRYTCACSDGRRRLIRGNRADRRQDRVDRDAVGLHGHARAPRLHRRRARSTRKRGIGGRNRRTERCRGPLGTVCLFRPPRDERATGLRRSAADAARAICTGLEHSGRGAGGGGDSRRRGSTRRGSEQGIAGAGGTRARECHSARGSAGCACQAGSVSGGAGADSRQVVRGRSACRGVRGRGVSGRPRDRPA